MIVGGFEAEQIADTEVNSQPETTGPELTDTDLWLLNQLLKGMSVCVVLVFSREAANLYSWVLVFKLSILSTV